MSTGIQSIGKFKLITLVALAIIAIPLLAFRILREKDTSKQTSPLLVVAVPESSRSETIGQPKQLSTQQVISYLGSGDVNRVGAALEYIHHLTVSNPEVFVKVLPKCLPPLVNHRQFTEVESLAMTAIHLRPQSADLIAKYQYYRVLAFLAGGQYQAALMAAKGYYNVATLKDSPTAVDLVCKVLAADPNGEGSALETQFRGEQLASIQALFSRSVTDSDSNAIHNPEQGMENVRPLLDTIAIDSTPYNADIIELTKVKSGYSNSMGAVNLLLLADRLSEAQESLINVSHNIRNDDDKLRSCIDGFARLIRDQTGSIQAANDFIINLRNGDRTSLPAALAIFKDEQLKRVATEIKLGSPPRDAMRSPALEDLREASEDRNGVINSKITIDTGLECSSSAKLKQITPTHFEIILAEDSQGWFLFRVHGVDGKVVRFDIKKNNVPAMINWWAFNPVYTYSKDLSNESSYSVGVNSIATTRASNGIELSAPVDQSWHWIENAWIDDTNTVSFVQKYSADDAYIALRIPHPPSYVRRHLQNLNGNRFTKVIEIGRSAGDQPLLVVQVRESDTSQERPHKRCALIYAGEHADEHDAMWVAEGAIKFLTSNDDDARRIRQRLDFIIIPMLDPDASAAGRHAGIITSFVNKAKSPESIAYANWFQQWVNDGNRLDVVFDLHAGMEADGANVGCALAEGLGERGALSTSLYLLLVKQLGTAGYTTVGKISARGWSPDRLGGWLSRRYGPITFAPEINSEAPNHLSAVRTQAIGEIFVKTIDRFLSMDEGARLQAIVDIARQERSSRWSAHPLKNQMDAIEAEAEVSQGVGIQRDLSDTSVERWVP